MSQRILVKVYTRWHQMSVLLGFALSISSFLLIANNGGAMLFAAVVSVLGLVGPGLIAFLGFPTQNQVLITPDGLQFSRRAFVPFSEIRSWGSDDFLKLVRHHGPTLLLSALDRPMRRALDEQFEQALKLWQSRGQNPAPVRTQFYGGWQGRAVAGLIMVLSLVVIVLSLMTQEPRWHLTAVGGLGMAFGAVMFTGRKPF